jgi:hypothetical protein
MNVLIILSILFIIIWYCIYKTEGFEDPPIDPKVEEKYQKFAGFYNPFLVDWEKAIVTSIGLETPVKPLTNPGDTSTPTLKAPTRIEMNNYIKKLEKTLNKPLPLITDPLPNTLTTKLISDMAKNTSMEPAPYENALQIMVKYQEDAQKQMEEMKKSPEGFDDMNPYWTMEGFQSCDEYTKCMTDPNVVDAVAKAQAEQQAREQEKKQKELENKLDMFNENKSLQNLTAKNKEYMQKAKEIQDKATSGTLLNDFNLSNNDTSLDHFIKPKGIYNLENMKRNNPTQYATYEKNNAQMMSVASLNNSISNTLAGK